MSMQELTDEERRAAAAAHDGHKVHPHDHSGQSAEYREPDDWCSGRYLCITCATEALPRGVWFDGHKCPRPAVVAQNGKVS